MAKFLTVLGFAGLFCFQFLYWWFVIRPIQKALRSAGFKEWQGYWLSPDQPKPMTVHQAADHLHQITEIAKRSNEE